MSKMINRRSLLASMSAASGAAIAGCLGDDGDDGDDDDGDGVGDPELGERVPSVPINVYAGISVTPAWEQASGHLLDILEDLGIDGEISVIDSGTLRDNMFNDAREHNLQIDYHRATPERLDPEPMLRMYAIDYAGANGLPSPHNYASCEFSTAFAEQRVAEDPEERANLVQEALEAASRDIEQINMVAETENGAYRTDQVDISHLGDLGAIDLNYLMLRHSTPIGDADSIAMNATGVHLDEMYPGGMAELWSNTVYSPLVTFDENRELYNELATNYEVEDSFQTFIFELRPDATFHDGEPITAEDVKYTYEFIEDNIEEVTVASPQSYESINVIDDQTVEINFNSPNPAFVITHAARWGIVPAHDWIEQGAEEVPGNPDLDPVIGSGPFVVESFEQEGHLLLSPYEDHWDPGQADVDILHYTDLSAAQLAFEQGDLNIFANISMGASLEIEDHLDEAEVTREPMFIPTSVFPQHSFGVSCFEEWRHAFSEAIDREFVNEIVAAGQGEIMQHSCMIGPTHPFYPEDNEGLRQIAETTSGDIERAREILEDHNWGWDDDGNLHYPPGATPELWPAGSTPADVPEDFPCVEELDLEGFQ